MTFRRHSRPSHVGFFRLRSMGRKLMNQDIESSQEDTTNFSISERFHGQPCVGSSRTHLPDSNLISSLSFDQWSSLEAHTKPPYTLTLKSNGCIIFVAALSPSKLLVTSKHSLGPVQGSPESHAQAGESWLHHHLERAGKTTEQLAETLWAKNWTVAAEVRRPTPTPKPQRPSPTRSSATTDSRSTSSRTPPKRPACTCTASTNVRGTSGRSQLPSSRRSRANGASSPPRRSSSHPCRTSRRSRKRSAAAARGTARRSRASSYARPSGPRIDAPPLKAGRRRLVVLLQGQVRRAVHDVPRLARNHKGAARPRRGGEASEEQDGAPRNEGVCQVGQGRDQKAPGAIRWLHQGPRNHRHL